MHSSFRKINPKKNSVHDRRGAPQLERLHRDEKEKSAAEKTHFCCSLILALRRRPVSSTLGFEEDEALALVVALAAFLVGVVFATPRPREARGDLAFFSSTMLLVV